MNNVAKWFLNNQLICAIHSQVSYCFSNAFPLQWNFCICFSPSTRKTVSTVPSSLCSHSHSHSHFASLCLSLTLSLIIRCFAYLKLSRFGVLCAVALALESLVPLPRSLTRGWFCFFRLRIALISVSKCVCVWLCLFLLSPLSMYVAISNPPCRPSVRPPVSWPNKICLRRRGARRAGVINCGSRNRFSYVYLARLCLCTNN